MRHRANILERRVLKVAGAGAPLRRALRRVAIQGHTPSPSMNVSATGSERVRPLSPVDSTQRSTAAPSQSLRVLIVEDEAIIAMEIETTLHDLGAEVVGVAATAAEALRLADLHRPDFATMDVSIKGDTDGVSAAIEIYKTLGIRSVFVSAYGNDEITARAAPAQPYCWVKKPFDVEKLRSALDRVRNED